MIYSYDVRVNFDKAGADGRADIEGIMDYLNDCCFFHSKDVGMGIYDTLAYDRTWMVVSWQIVVDRYPKAFEKLKISTMGVGYDRLFAYRNHYITDENGDVIVRTFSYWTWTNMKNGHPANLLEEKEAIERFRPEPDRLEMDYAPRRIEMPKGEGKELPPVGIAWRHLDANGHVNNSKFTVILEEALGMKLYPKQLRVEYKKQAFEGDVITCTVWDEEDRAFVQQKNQRGDICCNMEFIKE